MSAAQPAFDMPHDAPDPRVVRADERVAMLRELAELGMAMARDLTRRTVGRPQAPPPDTPAPAPAADPAWTPAAEAANPAPVNPAPPPATTPAQDARRESRHDPAESFARLSRAVRLTLAQEAKAEAQAHALRNGAAADEEDDNGFDDADDPEEPYWEPPRDYPCAQRNKVRDCVHGAMNNEIEDLYEAQEMLDTLYERLLEGGPYDAFIQRPLRECVEAICADLGLHPDWSLWTGEGWPPPPPGPYRAWQRLWTPMPDRFPWLAPGSGLRPPHGSPDALDPQRCAPTPPRPSG